MHVCTNTTKWEYIEPCTSSCPVDIYIYIYIYISVHVYVSIFTCTCTHDQAALILSHILCDNLQYQLIIVCMHAWMLRHNIPFHPYVTRAQHLVQSYFHHNAPQGSSLLLLLCVARRSTGWGLEYLESLLPKLQGHFSPSTACSVAGPRLVLVCVFIYVHMHTCIICI